MADTKPTVDDKMETDAPATSTTPVVQEATPVVVPTETKAAPVETQPKRTYVDADDVNTELPDKKRGRMELDKPQRDLVLRYILAAHVRIAVVMSLKTDKIDELFKNLHVSQQITSIFGMVHNCLRQESLSIGALKTAMEARSHLITSGSTKSKEVKHTEIKAMIKELAKSFKLEYSRPKSDDNNHWYGTVSPILSFINMFKVRLGELRIGHSSMIAKKSDGKVSYVAVSQYGFYPPHHINLEGISLPPEKKSGMAQSLGPLTCLISLAKGDADSKYTKRWKSAVQKTMSFLPEIDSIVQVCAGKKASEVKRLYNIIADILLMTTSRESKRAAFPAFMLLKLLTESEMKHYVENNTIYQGGADISYFNFSGNGGFYLYNSVKDVEWTYPIKSTKKDYLSQIMFHSIWGTYAEDFGVLQFATGVKNWKKRAELDDAFEKMGTQEPATFKIIPFEKYSKLTSANQTGLLSVTSSQVTTRSPFSGKTKHTFGDEFFQYMESTHNNIGAAKKDIETLSNILQATKVSLLEDIKSNPSQDRGTTDWHDAATMTKTKYGTKLTERPSTSRVFFLQASNK